MSANKTKPKLDIPLQEPLLLLVKDKGVIKDSRMIFYEELKPGMEIKEQIVLDMDEIKAKADKNKAWMIAHDPILRDLFVHYPDYSLRRWDKCPWPDFKATFQLAFFIIMAEIENGGPLMPKNISH